MAMCKWKTPRKNAFWSLVGHQTEGEGNFGRLGPLGPAYTQALANQSKESVFDIRA